MCSTSPGQNTQACINPMTGQHRQPPQVDVVACAGSRSTTARVLDGEADAEQQAEHAVELAREQRFAHVLRRLVALALVHRCEPSASAKKELLKPGMFMMRMPMSAKPRRMSSVAIRCDAGSEPGTAKLSFMAPLRVGRRRDAAPSPRFRQARRVSQMRMSVRHARFAAACTATGVGESDQTSTHRVCFA